jgi:hypothetical protein
MHYWLYGEYTEKAKEVGKIVLLVDFARWSKQVLR